MSIFLGYPQQPPSLAEVLRMVAKRRPGGYECQTWEDLRVSGKVVMKAVLEAIENAEFCIFDVTRQNPNVLFEAGFAIARGKAIWLTMDSTKVESEVFWNDLAILKPIGYFPYRNSYDIVGGIESTDPVKTLSAVYDTLVEPNIPDEVSRTSLMYCPPYAPYEASNQLSSLVNDYGRRGLQLITADPQESSLNPITWYAPKLAAAAGVLINFAGAGRKRAEPHNSRNAFVAGMAVGLEIDLLMVSEDDYGQPFDYGDMLHVYSTAAQCVTYARPWLDNLDVEPVREIRQRKPRSKLADIRLGEHVAENELADLTDYFIETAAYRDTIRERDTLFIGRRGTGKTANALQAFNRLASNKDNLAVLIKPSGFEFPGLLAAIDTLPPFTHDYLFDTLWRFLIQTEVCAAAIASIDQRPPYIPNSKDEVALLEYAQLAPFDVKEDIAVRLDQALQHLKSRLPALVNVETGRVLVNEAFHSEALAELRQRLGAVLKSKQRVAVFIDNLDKGWDRSSRLSVLARLILGLLTARGRVVTDFSKQDWWRDRIKLTVAIFLRSDIYAYVKKEAREPDKLNTSTIAWRDPETLLSILEERLESTWTGRGKLPKLWGEVFPGQVNGTPTPVFLVETVLPRPRDLVYLCNAAVSLAVDRRHDMVHEEDLLSAREVYSQYAYEALLVENGVTIPEMEAVLFSFLGSCEHITYDGLSSRISAAGIAPEKVASVRARLIETSFLGIETTPGEFQHPEIGAELDRALALASRVQPDVNKRRFAIHPAFHQFLGIASDSPAR